MSVHCPRVNKHRNYNTSIELRDSSHSLLPEKDIYHNAGSESLQISTVT